MFDRSIALLMAIWIAFAVWPIALSRLGFSIIFLPLILTLMLWQGFLGWQTGQLRHWLVAGSFAGLAQYIYIPAKIIPIILLPFGLLIYLLHRNSRFLVGSMLFGAITILFILPLLFQPSSQIHTVARVSDVFILNPTYFPDHPAKVFLRQVWTVLLMFFYNGDILARHNVPGRPVYDIFTVPFAFIGLWVFFKQRYRLVVIFWFLWMGAMLLPTILTEGAPHFLRASGILPLVFVLPAVGLGRAIEWLKTRQLPHLAVVLPVAVLSLSLVNTVHAYFLGPYPTSRELYYAFDGPVNDLAVGINRFLGAGWDGESWTARDVTPEPGRQVFIAQEMWDRPEHLVLKFLVPWVPDETPTLRFIETALPDADPEHLPDDVMVIVAPDSENPALARLLPAKATITVSDGPPRSQATSEPLFRQFVARRGMTYPSSPLACWAGAFELASATLRVEGRVVTADLVWHARQATAVDYSIFTHYVRNGEIVTQSDGYPAQGYFPTSWWRAGDYVEDARVLVLPDLPDPTSDFVRIGLYQWQTLERLPVSDCRGRLLGDFLILQIPATGR